MISRFEVFFSGGALGGRPSRPLAKARKPLGAAALCVVFLLFLAGCESNTTATPPPGRPAPEEGAALAESSSANFLNRGPGRDSLASADSLPRGSAFPGRADPKKEPRDSSGAGAPPENFGSSFERDEFFQSKQEARAGTLEVGGVPAGGASASSEDTTGAPPPLAPGATTPGGRKEGVSRRGGPLPRGPLGTRRRNPLEGEVEGCYAFADGVRVGRSKRSRQGQSVRLRKSPSGGASPRGGASGPEEAQVSFELYLFRQGRWVPFAEVSPTTKYIEREIIGSVEGARKVEGGLFSRRKAVAVLFAEPQTTIGQVTSPSGVFFVLGEALPLKAPVPCS